MWCTETTKSKTLQNESHIFRSCIFSSCNCDVRSQQKNQNAAKRASSLEHGWQCTDVPCAQDTTVEVSGHLLARWRPTVIAMAAELAAALMTSASVDVTGASDSASTVIDSGPVDSMMLPSGVRDPISSSCHTVDTQTNSLAYSTAILSHHMVFLEWPKQQCHHEDHYSQRKYSSIRQCCNSSGISMSSNGAGSLTGTQRRWHHLVSCSRP